jgi:hypothetical protein
MTQANPLLAPDLSRRTLTDCKAELPPEEQERLLQRDDDRLTREVEAAAAHFDEQWSAAVERAQAMPDEEGILRSVWTGPLDVLVGQVEVLASAIGVDPARPVPKSTAADKHEKALPDHARGSYRRGVHLRKTIGTALKKRRQPF